MRLFDVRGLEVRVGGENLVDRLRETDVWLNGYETLDDARRGIGGYVDRYHHRPHSGSELKSEHRRSDALERREPGKRELAERTGIDPEHAEALLAAGAQPRSLDERRAGAEGEISVLGDLPADPLSTDADEQVLDETAGEQLRAMLVRLTAREREVVDARLGFDRPLERLAGSASAWASAPSGCASSRSARAREAPRHLNAASSRLSQQVLLDKGCDRVAKGEHDAESV